MSFLILGIPRTRTAWLSVFFDCEHEPTRRLGSLEVARRATDGIPASDPNLLLCAEEVMDSLGDAVRVAAVWRPRALLVRSLTAHFGMTDEVACKWVDRSMSQIERIQRDPRVRAFDTQTLDGVPEMWEWLCPAMPFPVERYERMRHMTVQARDPVERFERMRHQARGV